MNYISFRAMMSSITALLVALVAGKKIIAWLQKKQIGETIRDLGLEGQMAKKGTPTMGGIIIILSIQADPPVPFVSVRVCCLLLLRQRPQHVQTPDRNCHFPVSLSLFYPVK